MINVSLVDPYPPITNYSIPTTNSVPDAIILGPDNHTLWFTEIGVGNIGEFNSQTNSFGTTHPINESGAMPATLAADNRGLIWFTDQNQNSPSIWFLNTTSGTFHRFSTNSSPSDPIFVMVDPTTNYVWFTDYYGNYLGEITGPNAPLVKHSLPGPNSYPVEIAKQNGSPYLWITEANDKIARFDTSTNTTQEYIPSVSLLYPVGIVVDNTGNVWISEHGGSSIVEFTPSTSTWKKYPTSQSPVAPGTGVATLAMDSKGRLWFAEHYANRIGRFDPSTGEMDEFSLPIPGAYSLYDTFDVKGNFWFTEATANQIGMIPGNVTVPVRIKPITTPSASVTAGSSTNSEFIITNNNQTSPITVALNVTSSLTTKYYTTKTEVSLTNYTLTLGPGQSQNVTAVLTPDFSLGSGSYSAGIVAIYGKVSTVNTVILQVNANPLYTLETLTPWILIAAALVLLAVFVLFRIGNKRRTRRGSVSVAKTGLATAFVALLLFLIQETGLAWGKCPGLPPPPSGSGPDPYGIALDVGSILFFAIVAYFLIRSRLRGQSWAKEDDQTQASPAGNGK
jgi:virginiamycin B lyase